MDKRKLQHSLIKIIILISSILLIINALDTFVVSSLLARVNARLMVNAGQILWNGAGFAIILRCILDLKADSGRLNYAQRGLCRKLSRGFFLLFMFAFAMVVNRKIGYFDEGLVTGIFSLIIAVKTVVFGLFLLSQLVLKKQLKVPVLNTLSKLKVVKAFMKRMKSMSFALRNTRAVRIQLILVGLAFYSFENFDRFKQLPVFMGVFLFGMFFADLLSYQFKSVLSNVQTRSLGLDYFEKPLLILNEDGAVTQTTHVFEIDITDLIPQGAHSIEIVADDLNFTAQSGLGQTRFLVAISERQKPYNVFLEDFYIKYALNEEDYVVDMVMSFTFAMVGGVFALTEASVNDREVFSKDSMSYRPFQKASVLPFDGRAYLNLLYSYNSKGPLDLSVNEEDSRKLKLEESLSAYNAKTLGEVGLKGVHVSLGKDTGKKSMLSSLHRQVVADSKPKGLSFDVEVFPVLVSLVSILLTISVFILLNLNHFPRIMAQVHALQTRLSAQGFLSPSIIAFLFSASFVSLIAAFSTFLIAFCVVRWMVTTRSDQKSHYKDFFIDAVYDYVMEHNVVMIFDDLDSLGVEATKHAFTLLENLNLRFKDSKRVIGLASMNPQHPGVARVFITTDEDVKEAAALLAIRDYLNAIVSYYTQCCVNNATPRDAQQIALSEKLLSSIQDADLNMDRARGLIDIMVQILAQTQANTTVNDKPLQLELASMALASN